MTSSNNVSSGNNGTPDADLQQWESMLGELLLAQLRAAGLLESTETDIARMKARLAPLYGRWFDESLRVLSAQGLIDTSHRSEARLFPHVRSGDAIWRDWARHKQRWLENPDFVAKVALVESTLKALPEIIGGRKLATDVMFRQSSMEGVTGIYKDNSGADLFNSAIADTVVAYLEERIALGRREDVRIRILEVGAGTGGTTGLVLRKLAKYSSMIEEYCYTDISRSFLLHGQKEFASANPFLRFHILDVEQPLAGQGIEAGSYDLVIATNVLHATRNIRHTLRHVKAVLRRSGLLLLNEMSSSGGLFTHLTFGLLKGWWAFEDDALRLPGCPGLAPETWKSVLESEGFESVFFPLEEFHVLGQLVAIAESDGIVRRANPVHVAKSASRTAAAPPAAATPAASIDRASLERVADVIVARLAEVLQIEPDDVVRTESFADCGLDSISGASLVHLINESLGIELETISLFDYASVRKLSEFVLQSFGDRFTAADDTRISPAIDISSSVLNEIHAVPAAGVVDGKIDLASLERVAEVIVARLAEVLQIEPDAVVHTESFADCGLDSISGASLVHLINESLGIELETISLFDYASVRKLSEFVLQSFGDRLTAADVTRPSPAIDASLSALNEIHAVPAARVVDGKHEPIAVIGIAGRFASARSPRELWQHLVNGSDLVVGTARWSLAEATGDADTALVKGGFLDSLAEFDPLFFNISGLEATYMDPQQRLFLEESWHALEDAGHAGDATGERRWGVYVGSETSGEYMQLFDGGAPAQALWGNNVATLPARLAYFLDLHGPAVTINTACSSSLVAIHHACQALWLDDVELVIAGGVTVHSTPTGYVSLRLAGMLSPSGRCFTFDERADGFVPAEAVGAVVMKRLSAAVAEGDHVYGVIRGSAINQDGTTNGITAPSAKSQERLERFVYDTFHIDPARLQMLEAHGTATELGDPIEFSALTRAFRHYTDAQHYCAIGSIKTNMGHATAASGLAGMVKVLLSLQHRKIPASLNFQNSNPRIAIDGSPFYVNTTLRDWEPQHDADGRELPRMAGLSSFGMSGTNAHMVLEESTLRPRVPPALPGYLIVLSARTEAQLREQAQRLANFLGGDSLPTLGNMAFTLLLGRRHLANRLAFVVSDTDELHSVLLRWLEKGRAPQLSAGRVNEQQRREQPALKRYANECIERCRQSLPVKEHLECLGTIAELFAQGYELDYARLHPSGSFSRVSLPTYPFERESYWVPEIAPDAQSRARDIGASSLDSLLHHNVSTFEQIRFTSEFSADDPALRAIEGEPVLRVGAHLAMLHRAFAYASGCGADELASNRLRMRDVLWAQPVSASNVGRTVRVDLLHNDDGTVEGEIALVDGVDREPLIVAQATLERAEIAQFGHVDVEALRIRTGNTSDVVIAPSGAKLKVLRGRDADAAPFALAALPPCTGDSALAAILDGVLALSAQLNGQVSAWPQGIEELLQLAEPAQAAWVVVRQTTITASGAMLDAEVCDESGTCLLRIVGLTTCEALAAPTPAVDDSLVLLTPVMRHESAIASAVAAPELPRRIILCDVGSDDSAARHIPALQNALPDAHFTHIAMTGEADEDRFTALASALIEELKACIRAHATGAVLLQLVLPCTEADPTPLALQGMLRSASLEQPGLVAQILQVPPRFTTEAVLAALEMERDQRGGLSAHLEGKRSLSAWRELTHETPATPTWKEGGVYLFSGGAGGVALALAEDLARHVSRATVILLGRSKLDATRAQRIQALEAEGVQVDYRRLDVSDGNAVHGCVAEVLSRYGALNGVVHAAGVTHDRFLLQKTTDELRRVFAPKVAGAIHLDAATAGVKLDFFVMCSAVAGVLGNVGQADYAAANAYLDQFAQRREQLCESGRRQGRSLSIAWPLWAEGGMRMDPEQVHLMRARIGLSPMDSATGRAAFHTALRSGESRVVVLYGDPRQIRTAFLNSIQPTESAPVDSNPATPLPTIDSSRIREQVVLRLRRIFGQIAQLPLASIESDVPLERYGIDSILISQLNAEFEAVFGELSKTLLYQFQTLDAVAEYFVANHADVCTSWCAATGNVQRDTTRVASAEAAVGPRPPALRSRRPRKGVESLSSHSSHSSHTTSTALREPIAIVGMSGRYPDSPDVESFWRSLCEGRDCIGEIPAQRWPADALYFPDRDAAVAQGGYYAKWGGFLEGFAEFDPLFFGIAPREAFNMDPQERLFLESCWSTLEDAGYTRARLAQQHARRVGVFAGVTKTGFGLHGPQLWADGEAAFPHTSFGSIANRVSYLLDLSGPSMPIDTMCSSSLTAIHEACEHLHRGECELALAGGVNLYLHVSNYVGLAAQRMLSSDGRCRSFGAGGDGFVPGEGVGTVLLKPLSRAERDGDVIHAVILATAINHGGKTNGYTVPNPVAQAELIRSALERAGVDARRVGYIEAHGTGTSLGDPIEVSGLTQAFSTDTTERQFCALGSVKSNIGHLEAAAGIAGVTKLVLQLRHGEWVPSLHAEELNPNIDFGKTPFFVQRTRAPWPRLLRDGREWPRVGGISAFGAGGANAHALIEEYLAPAVQVEQSHGPVLFVLSARTSDRLQAQVRQWQTYLADASHDGISLADIAYTLQIGREPMDVRLGLLAETRAELIHKLDAVLQDRGEEEGVYLGQVKRSREALSVFEADEDLQAAIAQWVEKGKYGKLLDLWVKGLVLDWSALYGNTPPRRVSLPTYPFARELFWLQPVVEAAPQDGGLGAWGAPRSVLHPLLHENTSDLSVQRYSARFDGTEPFFADHEIGGRHLLPGVAYLEMAREAVARAVPAETRAARVLQLRNVAWLRPVVASEDGVTVHVCLQPREDTSIGFTIHAGDDPAPTSDPNCQGSARFVDVERSQLSLSVLQERCVDEPLDSAAWYARFATLGMNYGPAQRGIASLRIGDGEVLCRLRCPSHGDREYVLHPALLDSALQAVIGLSAAEPNARPRLPFAVESVDVFEACPAEAWAWVRTVAGSDEGDAVRKYDIDVADTDGLICVSMRGFASRRIEGSVQSEEAAESYEPALLNPGESGEVALVPIWQVQPTPISEATAPEISVVCIGATNAARDLLATHFGSVLAFELDPNAPIDAVSAQLGALPDFGCIWWFAPNRGSHGADDPHLVTGQDDGVLALFRLVKALLQLGFGTRILDLTVVTHRCQPVCGETDFDPTDASIHGLVGSLAKEYGKWRVRLADVDDFDAECAEVLAGLEADPLGNAWARRNGEWYRHMLVPTRLWSPPVSRYRKQGVYVIIGGAGGLGEVLTEHLIRTQDARVIWIGRRSPDDAIRARIERFNALGVAPLYLQADATDPDALGAAREEILRRFGHIHGLVHSAIVLADQSLARMDEERFRAAIAVKVDVSVCMARVFAEDALDFVLFFSSLQSFSKAPGQSNYAAGCTFGDAFAARLRADRNYPVKVVNWGFWGSVGVVASDFYRRRMAQIGFASIEPDEAMAALEPLLSDRIDQLAYLKLSAPLPFPDVDTASELVVYPERIAPDINALDADLRDVPLEAPASTDARDAGGDDPMQEVDALLARLLRVQMQECGLCDSEPFTFEQRRSRIEPQFGRWFRESLRLLEIHGLLLRDGDTYVTRGSEPAAEVWADWQRRIAEWRTDPNLRAQVGLVDTTIQALPQILAGRRLATDFLFRDAGVGDVEDVYQGSSGVDYFNALVASAVDLFMRQRRADGSGGDAGVRILEIGAGTGATSAAVFQALDSYRGEVAEYCYTDISRAFLLHAQDSFQEAAPYLSTHLFNVESPPEAQGIDIDAYDIVIATNVLHATRDIRRTLRNAKRVMRRNGLLLLNEMSTGGGLFTHLTFGLTKGWWLFEDESVRIPGSPALAPETWRRLLRESGFDAIHFPAESAHGLGQCIILAQSDGVVSRALEATKSKAAGGTRTVRASTAESSGILSATRSPTLALVRGAAGADEVQVRQAVLSCLALSLRVDPSSIDADEAFVDFGLDSILGVRTANEINEALGIELNTTSLFDYPTANKLVTHIVTSQAPTSAGSPPAEGETDSRPRTAPPAQRAVTVVEDTMAQQGHVQSVIAAMLATALRVDADAIDVEEAFAEYGLDSILGVRIANEINEALSIELTTTSLFDYPSVARLARYINEAFGPRPRNALAGEAPGPMMGSHGKPAALHAPAPHRFAPQAPATAAANPASGPAVKAVPTDSPAPAITKQPIAIVGMSARYAGSEDVDQLWQHLAEGRELINTTDRWEILLDGAAADIAGARGGFLDDIDQFDPLFFSISAIEATYMDPQQRLFLQESWHALENAGYASNSIEGSRCGVYVGCGGGDYRSLFGAAPPQAFWGNSGSIIPARIAYLLDLKGPAVTVDTACSSSLVAMHIACQGLWTGEIDLALAGGVMIQCTPMYAMQTNSAGMVSPDGRCYTFDDRANGFVQGEGVGVVVLKRLADALAAGDHVHGVIRGIGLNQDGATNGITAPNAVSQEALERRVYDEFGINADDIQMVEAHGTGTRLGDPIEFRALTNAFRNYTTRTEFCAIGSIKTNIGHTATAAGVAGVIKVLLSLRERAIPPSLNFEVGNSHIDFAASPFFVNTTLREWKVPHGARRCAAVSSFGFSGTNAHLVIEEAAPSHRVAPQRAAHLVVLSARTVEQLRMQAERLAGHLERNPQLECGDVAHTLMLGRRHLSSRLACVVADLPTLSAALRGWLAQGAAEGVFDSVRSGSAPQENVALRHFGEQCLADCCETESPDILTQRLTTVADLFVQGYRLDYARLFTAGGFGRIPLPTYPFARQSYWVAADPALPLTHDTHAANASTTLLQQNTSDLSGMRFSSRVTDVSEGDVYLGMALEAVRQLLGEPATIGLRSLLWNVAPPAASSPFTLHARLRPVAEGELVFDVSRDLPAQPALIECRGSARTEVAASHPALDLVSMRENLPEMDIPGTANAWGDIDRLVVRLDACAADIEDAIGVATCIRRAVRIVANWRGDGHLARIAMESLLIESSIGEIEWLHASVNPAGIDVQLLDAAGSPVARLGGLGWILAGECNDAKPSPPADDAPEDLDIRVLHALKQTFSRVTAIAPELLDGDESLDTYGLDSLLVTQLNVEFEAVFGELSKTLLYEHATLRAIANHFCQEHPAQCVAWIDGDMARASVQTPGVELPLLQPLASAATSTPVSRTGAALAAREPIAIIGISGSFPGAANLEEFWELLSGGHDAVSEIPAERWPVDLFYCPDPEAALKQGKYYAKWGGFLEGFADFDPIFFGITPRDAMDMDPQERLFLTSCWTTLENAGYTRERLAREFDRQVGVFAGITKTGYELHSRDLWSRGEEAHPHTSFSSIANRVSYVLNLAGPSMPIDTMCSSSLTAIHEACEHLHREECALALAGGVNLYLHPSNFVALCVQRMMASDGRSRSFGAGGDGFGPGEGVGSVLLKPLKAAERDGDIIHAIIRGSAINHGGKTNGFTVPSPVAQASVVRQALQRAGVDARRVSYVEAHGTGTALGDPVEIGGLSRAFAPDTDERQFCAIGAVKSNIGHLEAAAGIAGIAKLVLQMKHGMLAPSLHADTLNPNIDFAASPFLVQRTAGPWKRPVIDGRECPRIAGISSFGAGGSNAHIILEEYRAAPRREADSAPPPRVVVLVSARDEDRLQEYAARFADALGNLRDADVTLAEIAYTSQTAREPMEERLGVITDSFDDLERKLRGFAATGAADMQEVFRGRARRKKDAAKALGLDEDMTRTVDAWMRKRKFEKLLDLWVTGLPLEWHLLHGATPPRRAAIPTYPFAREKYWPVDHRASMLADGDPWGTVAFLHPLLHRNVSDFEQQCFRSDFDGDEFFVVGAPGAGRRLALGTGLEMARAALRQALAAEPASGTVQLSDVIWHQPAYIEADGLNLHMALIADGDDEALFELYAEQEGSGRVVLCEGRAEIDAMPAPQPFDFDVILADSTLDEAVTSSAQRSARLIDEKLGECIDRVWHAGDALVIELTLPPSVAAMAARFELNPLLLECVWHTALAWHARATTPKEAADTTRIWPQVLARMDIREACGVPRWAIVRSGTSPDCLDIDLCNGAGEVCLRAIGLRIGAAAATATSASEHSDATADDAVRLLEAFQQGDLGLEELEALLDGGHAL